MTGNYIQGNNGTIIVNGGVPSLTTDPTDFTDSNTPRLWVNSSSNQVKFYDGTQIRIIDTHEGQVLDAFGNELITDK